jgi:hypothetical protein
MCYLYEHLTKLHLKWAQTQNFLKLTSFECYFENKSVLEPNQNLHVMSAV